MKGYYLLKTGRPDPSLASLCLWCEKRRRERGREEREREEECVSTAAVGVAPVSGRLKEQTVSRMVYEKKPFEQSTLTTSQAQRNFGQSHSHQHDYNLPNDTLVSSRKPKVKKKVSNDFPSVAGPDPTEIQDAIIGGFCEVLEDFCGRSEVTSDDRDEAEWLPLPLADLKMLVNEIMSIRAKKVLHLVPVDFLVRVLRVLDHQIHRAEGSSVNDCENEKCINFSFKQFTRDNGPADDISCTKLHTKTTASN